MYTQDVNLTGLACDLTCAQRYSYSAKASELYRINWSRTEIFISCVRLTCSISPAKHISQTWTKLFIRWVGGWPVVYHLCLLSPCTHPHPPCTYPPPPCPYLCLPALTQDIPAHNPVPTRPHPLPTCPHPVPTCSHPVPTRSYPVPNWPQAVPTCPHPVPTRPTLYIPAPTLYIPAPTRVYYLN